MTLSLLHWLTTHGWYVWREVHYYYADHSRGSWCEWLASRSGR